VKKALFLTVGVCLIAGMVVPVSAQSGTVMLRGEVPFDFVSANRSIPAGQYSIEVWQAHVRIYDANRHPVQMTLSNPRQSNRNEEKPRLVFHKYGDTYFLYQVWTSDYKVEFRTSRTEYNLKATRQTDERIFILAVR
jgi:hypothetical protein